MFCFWYICLFVFQSCEFFLSFKIKFKTKRQLIILMTNCNIPTHNNNWKTHLLKKKRKQVSKCPNKFLNRNFLFCPIVIYFIQFKPTLYQQHFIQIFSDTCVLSWWYSFGNFYFYFILNCWREILFLEHSWNLRIWKWLYYLIINCYVVILEHKFNLILFGF